MSEHPTARAVALDALMKMEENEGYSNIVIDKALKSAGLDRRDASLASAIFYGVLEKRLTLDFYIAKCLKDPKKRLDKTVRQALRCGAYQIIYLDRVPDSAAVNETVELLKARGKAGVSGFVNGVLRSLSRRKAETALPEGSDAAALSIRYSVPERLIALWDKAYGRDITLKLLEAFQGRAETYIRINPIKTTFERLRERLAGRDMDLIPAGYPDGCAVLTNCGSPALLPEFEEGAFHVQDLSAQLVCELLDPRPGETVCDCCAAPGGKSFTIAERMEDRGTVFSLELYKGRAKLIESGAQRLGLGSITAKTADMTKEQTDIPPADKVLCDVPCSGFGVIRRKPEIRYKSMDSIKELPGLQYEILLNASKLLKPGGVLVYSTCTLDPAENRDVAERFLRENNGFIPRKIDIPGVARVADEPENMLTMTPFSGASDGFFAAAWTKEK